MKNQDEIVKYIQSLLFDLKIEEKPPEDIENIEELKEIDSTIRRMRSVINAFATGKLSDQIEGRGYLMGELKNLQSGLKNLIWQTRNIASGNFTQRVDFLGELSEAYNSMVEKLDTAMIAVKVSEERHRLLADHASDVIWTMDLSGKFTYISPSVEKLRGYTVEEVMKQSREEVLCPSSIKYLEQGITDAIFDIQSNRPFKAFRGDLEQPCKNGTTVWTDVTVSGMYDKENRFIGMLGVTRDITERKRMEEEIKRLSETDRLTDLNNRLKLDEYLKHEIERYQRKKEVFSIVMIDIDYFKKVNDTYGHVTGDFVLQEIAKIIGDNCRKIDMIGRWGGEEFLMILPDTKSEGAVAIANKLRRRIQSHQFMEIGNLTASFGVAEMKGNITAVELVSMADQALYQSKENGRNQVICYNSNLKEGTIC